MYEVEKKKIKDALGDVYGRLQENKVVLAGGAITSLFTNREIADFDLIACSINIDSQIVTRNASRDVLNSCES